MALNSLETKRKRNEKRKQFRHLKNQVAKFVEKECFECKLVKPCRFNSTFDIHGNPEYKSKCDDCHNMQGRYYTKKNRKKITFRRLQDKRERKIKYVQYLGGKCQKCGYSKSLRGLTFHHKERNLKEFSISQAIDHSWDKVRKELDKCALLCFNCHMEEEEKIELQKMEELKCLFSEK